jgi:hypothetical protein
MNTGARQKGEAPMKEIKWKAVLATATLTVAALGVHQFANAQQDQNPPPAPPGGGFNGRVRGGGGGGGTALAVSGSSVYIVRGNTIYRLDSTDLSVKAQANLPAPARRGGAGGARFRGGRAGNQGNNPT